MLYIYIYIYIYIYNILYIYYILKYFIPTVSSQLNKICTTVSLAKDIISSNRIHYLKSTETFIIEAEKTYETKLKPSEKCTCPSTIKKLLSHYCSVHFN